MKFSDLPYLLTEERMSSKPTSLRGVVKTLNKNGISITYTGLRKRVQRFDKEDANRDKLKSILDDKGFEVSEDGIARFMRTSEKNKKVVFELTKGLGVERKPAVIASWIKDEPNIQKVISQIKSQGFEATSERIQNFILANIIEGPFKSDLLSAIKKDESEDEEDTGGKNRGARKTSGMIENIRGSLEEKISKIESALEHVVSILKGKSGNDNAKFVKLIYALVRDEFDKRHGVDIFDFGSVVDQTSNFYAGRMSKFIGYGVASEILDLIDRWHSESGSLDSSAGKKIRSLLSTYAISDRVQGSIMEKTKRFLDAYESGKNTLDQTVDSISDMVQEEVSSFYQEAWRDNQAQLAALKDRDNLSFTAALTGSDPDVIEKQITGMVRG